ncbi:MAG: hypothetical protein DHS20C18_14990 [Saprospiraceae bacterium]|nr:MAG: hypothetical protein DHS20C18_14990 [Saprospiraceae bacterium]
MEENQFGKAFILLLSCVLILLLYPILHSNIPFLQEHFRTYSATSWLPQSTAPVDTLIEQSVGDTLVLIDTVPEVPKYKGHQYLADFYALLQSNSEQIRIAHFGDSSIEGDLITQTVRDSLQKRFGGNGVGFAPISSPIYGFRRTLNLRFSEGWYECVLGEKNLQELPRGYLGNYFTDWDPPIETPDSLEAEITTPKDSTVLDTTVTLPIDTIEEQETANWVRYTASRRFAKTNIFSTSRLFYGAPVADSLGHTQKSGSVQVALKDEAKSIALNQGGAINVAQLSTSPCRRIQLNFNIPDRQPIYGVSLESQRGVIVDNLPTRGNSGGWLMYLNESILNEFQEQLDVDLIMLQFGLNVLNAKMEDYSWYKKEMKLVIQHIRRGFPGASILVIGPSDRGIKIDGRMQTDPSVPRITDIQRQAAEESEAAFFSIYENMGGSGTMAKWVDEEIPPLANSDYTHFNFAGSEKVGKLFLEFLLSGYEDYLREQQNDSEQ